MKATTYYASALYMILSLLVIALLLRPTFSTTKSYVVYMGAHRQGKELAFTDITQSHYEFLGSFLGSIDKAKDAIFYSYNKHINGFAATIDDDVASKLSQHPKVISVFPNQAKNLDTTRSWDFLGLENNEEIGAGSLWKKARFGEDVIIANIDTGVWPESKSFSDEGMGPIPSRWKGACENENDPTFHCNRFYSRCIVV